MAVDTVPENVSALKAEVAALNELLAVQERVVVEQSAKLEHTFQELTAAEEGSRASGERLRSLVETVNDWIWEVNSDGVYTYASPRVRDLLGYEPEEVLGKTPLDLMPQEQVRLVAARFAEVVAAGKPVRSLVKTNVCKDGHLVALESSGLPFFSPDGSLMGYRGADRDITERKQVEKALRESQERYRVISEGSPHGILMADRKTRQFVYANPCMCRLLGYTEKELLQLGVADIHPKDSLGHVASEFESQVRGEKTLASELPCLRKDGTVFYADVTSSLVILAAGQECLVGFFADVTERKQAEQQLRERMKELQAFYSLAEIAEREGITLDKLYQEFTNILPQSWPYPEIACARIVIGDSEFRTENFAESPWKQSALVKVNGSAVGRIDVGYLEQKPEEDEGPFLKEERLLIDAIAERIGHITERKQAQQTQARLVAMLDATPDFVGFADAKDTHILYINPAGRKMVGVGAQEDVTRLKIADVHPEWTNRLFRDEIIPTAIRDGIWTGECAFLNRDSREIPVMMVLLAHKSPSGEVERFSTISRDITERNRAEEALRASEAHHRTLLEALPQRIFCKDRNSVYLYCNGNYARDLGIASHEIVGRTDYNFYPEELANKYRSDDQRIMKSGQTEESDERYTQDGREYTVHTAKTPLKDGEGNAVGVLGVFWDITERKRAEEEILQAKAELERLNAELEQALVVVKQSAMLADHARGDAEEKARVLDHASTHDSLTGLPNRQYLEARVQEHCEQAAAGKSVSFTVMFLDLDQFKLINDTLGHNAGDLVLVEVAARLRSCLRAEDILARMGGDEFTVIPHRRQSRSPVESVAVRILGSISRPYEIKGRRLVIGASIGLAMYPADGTDATTLLRHADAAMYKAKQAGRGTFRWYAGGTDTDDLVRLDLEGNLQSALDENQLRVYYQPIISLRDGSLRGAEALLRWEHPQRGMISPSVFIPVAEETGLITPIGDYVLRTACAQAKAWIDEGMPLSVIGVNVSIVQMRDDTWLDGVKAALSDTGLDAERLSLELTETAFTSDPHSLASLLRKIRGLGVGVAIDDFGMGHSSLSRLKDLPVSHLKIDGSFVRDAEDNDSGKAMLASIIEMAHNLGMEAIAEWVETKAQVESLRSSGCDFAQGYFFSPPLPADRFRAFALERTAPVSRKRRAAVVKAG